MRNGPPLSEKVEASSWTERQRAATAAAIASCDSPAEAALLVALLAHQGAGGVHAFGPPGSGAAWTLTTQHKVELPGGRRGRLDVALQRGALRVAVEVDGWAYHHATDDQEARDACRELALRLDGWRVLRFAAADALDAPARCVEVVVSALAQLELHGAPAPAPPDPLVARLREVAGDSEKEDEILRQAQARAVARLAANQARRAG